MIDPEYPDPRLAEQRIRAAMADGTLHPHLAEAIADARAKGREAMERGLAAALATRRAAQPAETAVEPPAAPAEGERMSGGSGDTHRAAAITDRELQEALYDHHISDYEEDSVRGPGWYRYECTCDWYTTGHEKVAEEAAYQHIAEVHMPGVRAVEPLIRRQVADRLRARLTAAYDPEQDPTVRIGDWESCGDSCAGEAIEQVLKLIDEEIGAKP